MNKKHDFWEYSFKLASLQHYNITQMIKQGKWLTILTVSLKLYFLTE